MKTNKYLYSLIAAVVLLFTAACSPDDYDMGPQAAKPVLGTDFTVVQDAANPNLVHLTNLKTGYNAFWVHPGVGTGHSQGDNVDLQIAFPGTYKIVYGVGSEGGVVYSDTVSVTINDMYAGFVTGDSWTNLAGGAGNSKTWIPDNGHYGMKQGFYSCFDPTATPADMTHDEGSNNWYAKDKTWWEPSNSDVGITDDDLAQTMTFSLKGSAQVTVTDASGNETTGTFAFDPNTGALSANGVEFAHGAWANGKSKSFSTDFVVLHLDENQLMIANKRDPALSGEGECWYVWNFVSKEYADNYHETVPSDYTLPDGWNNAVTKQTSSNITWVLNENTPYDWFTTLGARKNSYKVNGDYPAFIRPLANLGEDAHKITLEMNTLNNANTYKVKQGGKVVASGTFTLDDKGNYTFSDGLGDLDLGGSGNWIKFSADKNKQLRVLSYDTNTATGKTNNLWLGAREYDNDGNLYQYRGYHFTAVTYGDVIPYTAQLSYFDNGFTFKYSDPIDFNDDELNAKKTKQFTVTLNGASDAPYGIYFDVLNILQDHPNATLTLDAISVDGKALDLSTLTYTQRNEDGTQFTGDLPTTARIYILNPWNPASAASTDLYKFTNNITIKVTVALND